MKIAQYGAGSCLPVPCCVNVLSQRDRLGRAELGAEAAADKAMTIFPRSAEGQPILYDYQVKGFFKDACGMLGRIGGKTETGKKRAVNESGKLTAYKKIIDLADVVLCVYDTDIPATSSAEDRALAYAEGQHKSLVLLHPTELTTKQISAAHDAR